MEMNNMESDSSNREFTIEVIADLVAKELKKAAIPKWDLYLLEEHIFGLYLRKHQDELYTDTRDISYFIRIFDIKPDGQMGVGLVQANSVGSENIQKAINHAKSIAGLNLGPSYDLVTPGKIYASPKTTDKAVLDDPQGFLKKQGELIKKALQETMFVEPTFGKFRTYSTQKMLVNCEDLRLKKQSTYFCYEFSLKANKDGKIAEYWPKGYLKSVDHLIFDRYIPQWGTIARDTLRATVPETHSSIDVVFPPIVVRAALINTLGYASTASAYYDKTTKLNLGEMVADEQFTMVDDGLLPDGLNSSSWDGEGNPKQTTTIIDHGIMKNYLYDQKYAKLLKGTPTGNAIRHPEMGGTVNIDMNNLVISPSATPLRDMLQNIKKGLYVDEFSWLNPDPITGFFGAEIRNGYWIENGVLGNPIKGGNLSGNLFDMVKQIGGISKETHCIMNAKVPFIHFRNCTLSGK
jgi:PmbA protein